MKSGTKLSRTERMWLHRVKKSNVSVFKFGENQALRSIFNRGLIQEVDGGYLALTATGLAELGSHLSFKQTP